MEPSNQFAQQIHMSIQVWLKRISGASEKDISGLARKFPHLLRLIDYALVHPETQTPDTFLLVKESFLLVNQYGKWRYWTPILKICLSSIEDESDPLYITLLLHLGKCYSRMSQPKLAIDTHEKAKKLAEETSIIQLKLESLFDLCLNFRVIREYNTALLYGNKVIQLSKLNSVNDPLLLSKTYNEIGSVYYDQGGAENCAIAENHYQTALDYLKSQPSSALHYKIRINIGHSLVGQDRFEEALSTYKEAQKNIHGYGDVLDLSRLWNSFGVIYYNLQDYQKAEGAFLKANSQILRESGDIALAATINQNLGNALTKQNRLYEAEAYLWEAIRMWEKINNQVLLANTYSILGELESLKNQIPMSEQYYKIAIDILSGEMQTPYVKSLNNELLDNLEKLK